jgi:hypothetical protein
MAPDMEHKEDGVLTTSDNFKKLTILTFELSPKQIPLFFLVMSNQGHLLKIKERLRNWHFLAQIRSFIKPSMGPQQYLWTLDATL